MVTCLCITGVHVRGNARRTSTCGIAGYIVPDMLDKKKKKINAK